MTEDSQPAPRKSRADTSQLQVPYTLRNTGISKYILCAIPGCFTTFLLTTIDYLSVSMVYFPDPTLDKSIQHIPKTSPVLSFNYPSLSRLLFVIASSQAMVVYNFITKIGWGLYAGSIVENMNFTAQILYTCVKEVHNKYEDKDMKTVNGYNEMVIIVIVNSILACMIGTLLFALFSFGFFASGVAKLLESIPLPILAGFMGGLAFSQFKVFLSSVQVPEDDITTTSFELFNIKSGVLMFCFGLAIGITVYYFSNRYPTFSYTIILSLFISTILTYGTIFISHGSKTVKKLQEMHFLKNSSENSIMNLFDFYKIIMNFKYIDLKIIWACKWSIVNLSCFSLLHLPINFSVYRGFLSSTVKCERTMKKYGSSLSNEMKTQGISNIFSAFISFIPSYMVGSYSVGYRRGGGMSRIIGVLAALCNIALPFLGPKIDIYMPSFVTGGMSRIIGVLAALCNIALPFLGPKIDIYMPSFVTGGIPCFIAICFAYDFLIDIYNKIMSFFTRESSHVSKKQQNVNYDNLIADNFKSFDDLPKNLRFCDVSDFLISCVVLGLFICLDDLSILSLAAGFFLCFSKQYFYLRDIPAKNASVTKFSRTFGSNFMQTTVYNGTTYDVYKPTTINFWNIETFDDAKNPIIYDLRDLKYIDILAISRFQGDEMVIC